MRETFTLPNVDCLVNNTLHQEDKIVVISIVGKSSCDTFGLKIKSLGHMFSFQRGKNCQCCIEGYYDEENQIIYLHLFSLLDSDILIQFYDDIAEQCKNKRDGDDFLTIYDEVKTSFARALLLLFCVSHIVVLSHPGSSFDTNYIQYFKAVDRLKQDLNTDLIDALKDLDGLSPEWVSNCRPCTPRLIFYFDRCGKCISNVKKLEHNVEDKIYYILKKSHIICTSCPLFAIPLNEEYVFIASEERTGRLSQAVRELIEGCQPGRAVQVEAPYCNQPYSQKSFINFLHSHVQKARNKGFDDNVASSRHSHQQPAYFEVPLLKNWVEACKIVHSVVIQGGLVSTLCTDTSFSELRCLKVLPLAVARYQEGLGSHYSRATHESRLTIALALFGAQARGPVFNRYSAQLQADCQAYWKAGRQLCEVASLTGNPCTLPKHLSEQEHMSGIIYIAACDCGKIQRKRNDPYSPKDANYTFYQQISKDCQCSSLDKILFPIFQPSIKEFRAATLTENEDFLSVLSDRSTELTPDLERGLERQPSTTEYLPGMLTLNAPTGLLPYYSSWSLVCLGPSSLYSHNLGLSEIHHPGFLNTTNYLLPWDVTVYSKSKTGWSHSNKHSVRGRKPRPVSSSPQFTVKVFIGVEYECPRGHRFMLAAPDRVLRAAPGSIVKDTGHKIAESDMPLYFPCPCRPGKPYTAQLMRLHVVTPKAPVHCTLNPKVQPAAGAPVFVPTSDGPTSLTQSAYWIMRLPYVYVSDKNNYPENHSARLFQGVFGVTEIE